MLLDANEFVNNYVIPKCFENPAVITPEQKQAMIRTWGIILEHIENYLCITTLPFTVVNLPVLPTATALTGIDAAFGQGVGLTGTGAILATDLVNRVLLGAVPSQQLPQIIQNLTDNFNMLFEHICSKAVVTVSQVPHSGTVFQGTSSFGYGGVSQLPVTGIETSILNIVSPDVSNGQVSFTPPEADTEYRIELLGIISNNLKAESITMIVKQNDTELAKESLTLKKGILADTVVRVKPSATDDIIVSVDGGSIQTGIVTYVKEVGGGANAVKLR